MENEDLVNVIRCKDCEHFERKHEINGWCYYWNIEQGASPNMVDNDDYCSNGNKLI